jgi:hypothetical protein
MEHSTFADFVAAALALLARIAQRAGWHRLALGFRIAAFAVRWGLPLLM